MTSNMNCQVHARSDSPAMARSCFSVFDFDGTLTVKDSMMEIIIYHCGRLGLMWALLRQIHLIVLMLMGLYDNQKCKEHLLAYCFGGMKVEEFDALCQSFADSHKHIIRDSLMQTLRDDHAQGVRTYVISASPELWVSKFVPGIEVLGSKMEVVDGRITGRLQNRNCYGPEKVNRLLAAVPELASHRSDYCVTAYGDSKGDREMLAFADKGIKITN